MRRLLPLSLALCASLSGCASLGWIGQTFGSAVLPAINGLAGTRDADVAHYAYGPGERHQLDVYRPKGRRGPLPVCLFFYGGYWEAGSRQEYAFVGEGLASRGIVAVLPDYRIHPDAAFPAFVEDGARAARWLADHMAVIGGDGGRVTVMGHSAGAHIAALLALDERYLRAAGFRASPFAGFVGLAGPYDFDPATLPFPPAKQVAIFGAKETWAACRPLPFLTGGEPPMLLFHGTADTICSPRHTTNLAARAASHGVAAQTVMLPGIDHYQILAALAPPLAGLAPVLAPAASFIRAPQLAAR